MSILSLTPDGNKLKIRKQKALSSEDHRAFSGFIRRILFSDWRRISSSETIYELPQA
jgi:hypothetical protein